MDKKVLLVKLDSQVVVVLVVMVALVVLLVL